MIELQDVSLAHGGRRSPGGRMPVAILLLSLLCLVPACGGGGGGGGGAAGVGGNTTPGPGPVTFGNRFVDDFDDLDEARWELDLDEDVVAPTAEGGRLLFDWDGARATSRARLVLKQLGYYETAALEVPVLGDNVEARITIGLEAGGLARQAFIELEGGEERDIEVLIEDEADRRIDSTKQRFSRLNLPPGATDERIRFELDTRAETIRFFVADDLFFSYREPGLRVSPTSQVAIEVEGRDTSITLIDKFEAALLSEVPERSIADVLPNHTCPSRVQWLFKLRDASGDIISLEPDQVDSLVPRVFEDQLPIDTTETCPTVRTFGALPLHVAIVLDHTESMNSFNGIEGPDGMKAGAIALLKELQPTHTFSIWEFHDNTEDDGFRRLRAPQAATEEGVRDGVEVIRTSDPLPPLLRGFSLCWDTIDEALKEEFEVPDGDAAAGLRVITFFSDGFDNSSDATPADLLREARRRGVLFYTLGYGNLTASSRSDLVMLAGETGGVFAQAPTPDVIRPEFERLVAELSGYLQLAYVTGRFMDRNIPALVPFDFEGTRVQQLIRDFVDGDAISFNDTNQRYDTQVGVLVVDGPVLEGGVGEQVFELSVRAVHVPRATQEFKLSLRAFDLVGEDEFDIPLDDFSQVEVEVESNGPFEGWQTTSVGQDYSLAGPEPVCFGDFGPLVRVKLRAAGFPSGARFELKVDNGIYPNGVLTFSRGCGLDGVLPGDLDLEGNLAFTYVFP